MTIRLYVGREDPGIDLWCMDSRPVNPAPVNFTVGGPYTYTLFWRRRGDRAATPADTAITGISVSASATPSGNGEVDADVPSVHVDFTAGALDGLVSVVWERIYLVFVATNTATGRDREWRFPAEVET